jgi:phosphate transport system substrate-binding protein
MIGSIADGRYLISQSWFFYVKKAHIRMIVSNKKFLREFSSEKAWGEWLSIR